MKQPLIGCAFDPEQRNDQENIEAYLAELDYYRPRGSRALRVEGARLLSADDPYGEWAHEWMHDADACLTEWARRVARHEYISFGPFEHGGAVGFYIDVDRAIEDADLRVDDLSEVPRGFSGFVVLVNDHGNVTGLQFSRGRRRELFAVV